LPASSFAVLSGTEIRATTPAKPAGVAHLQVLTPAGASAASSADQFTYESVTQAIDFGALADKTYGDPDFTVSATASSGLPVTLGRSGNCTLNMVTVHITGAGSCTITASQAGNSTYSPATDVSRTFMVAKASQTVAVSTPAPATAAANASFSVAAIAPGGAVSYSSGGVCTNSGATFTMASTSGLCTVKYDQPGNANYHAAPQVLDLVTVGKAPQTITFGALANKTYGDADFVVSASATSGLAVSFAASGNCIVSAATVHLTGAGSCTVSASQAGNANYNAAPTVSRTFSIARKPLTPPSTCKVPKVVGKRLGAAKALIKRAHCRTGKVVYTYSRQRTSGFVVSQSRRPGKIVPANTRINLIVSRGRKQ
jgi:hypothetical protein